MAVVVTKEQWTLSEEDVSSRACQPGSQGQRVVSQWSTGWVCKMD